MNINSRQKWIWLISMFIQLSDFFRWIFDWKSITINPLIPNYYFFGGEEEFLIKIEIWFWKKLSFFRRVSRQLQNKWMYVCGVVYYSHMLTWTHTTLLYLGKNYENNWVKLMNFITTLILPFFHRDNFSLNHGHTFVFD